MEFKHIEFNAKTLETKEFLVVIDDTTKKELSRTEILTELENA